MECSLPGLIIPHHISKHTSLNDVRNINKMRYNYNHIPIVYAMVCENTQMIYVGSTWDSVKRFNKHLIKFERMNTRLLSDIQKYGLESITLYIFLKVPFDSKVSNLVKKRTLLAVEQSYIDMFTKDQLYNSINSVKLTSGKWKQEK